VPTPGPRYQANFGTPTSLVVGAVQAGELLVVKITHNGTTGNATVSGGGLTWTARSNVSATSRAGVAIFTAAVAADDADGFTLTIGGGTRRSAVCERWTDAGLDPTPIVQSQSGAMSRSMTTEGADSAITWVATDWNEGSPTGATMAGGGTLEYSFLDTNNYAGYHGYIADTDAIGAKTFGVSSPTSANGYVTGLEILHVPSATPVASTDSATLDDSSVDLQTNTPIASTDSAALSEAAPTLSASPVSTDSATLSEAVSLFVTRDDVDTASVADPGIPTKWYDAGDPAEVIVEAQPLYGRIDAPDPVTVLVDVQDAAASRAGTWAGAALGVPEPLPTPRYRFIAQAIFGGEFLHWELPVTDPEVTWTLSGATRIRASFRPEIRELADVGLEPWGTWIHLEEDGVIRGSGILLPTSIAPDGVLDLEAEGPHGYAARVPYRDRMSEVGIEVGNIVRKLWAHIQGFPRGDLGVTVLGSTPITKGTEARDVNFVTGEGEQVTFQAGPYTLDYWQNTMIGREIETLAKDTPFDFTEHSAWTSPARDAVKHWIQIHYPQAGQRRFDLRFAQGENIVAFAPVEEPDDAYADVVYVQGKGEGVDQIAGQASTSVGNRLRLPAVVTDKTIDSTQRANAVASEELAARLAALVEIPEILVDARHPNAPLGSYSVGDEIAPLVSYPYVGLVAMWHRITGITYLPALDRVRISLTRQGEFR
jgi:hypothetical protein